MALKRQAAIIFRYRRSLLRQLATSEDAAKVRSGEYIEEVREDMTRIFSGDGKKVVVEGALLQNIDAILKAEEAFSHAETAQVVRPVCDEQRATISRLRIAAAAIYRETPGSQARLQAGLA